MGYFEKMLVGAIMVISAYKLLNESTQRHQFHNAFSQLLTFFQLSECYCCLETLRVGASALAFTGGLALLLDTSVCLGLGVELGLLALEAIKLQYTSCICVYQQVLVHLLLIAVLASNCKCCEPCSPVAAEPVKVENVSKQESTAKSNANPVNNENKDKDNEKAGNADKVNTSSRANKRQR